MSTTETPTPAQPAPRRSRWRSFFVGSALVLSGVIIGVGTTAMSQGYDRYRDDDGPRGWRDGPRGWFGRDRDGPHGWHGGGRFGGQFLSPGRIERMVDRLGWAVDASSEQKQKLGAIIGRAADDLRPLRERHLEARRQAAEALAGPTIDRARLEALRVDQMQLADQASQRITAALVEAAEVLTPAQRADLARRLERWRRG